MVRRRTRLRWWLWVAGAAYVGVYAASARWGVTVSPNQRLGAGVVAGAVVLEDRWGSSTPPPAGRSFRTTPQHSLLYGFSHRFTLTWWPRFHEEAGAAPVFRIGPAPAVLPPAARYRSIKVPLWMLAAPLVLGVAWVALRRWRTPPGHCRGCGYDLRGTPGSVCPECGETAVKDPGLIPQ